MSKMRNPNERRSMPRVRLPGNRDQETVHHGYHEDRVDTSEVYTYVIRFRYLMTYLMTFGKCHHFCHQIRKFDDLLDDMNSLPQWYTINRPPDGSISRHSIRST